MMVNPQFCRRGQALLACWWGGLQGPSAPSWRCPAVPGGQGSPFPTRCGQRRCPAKRKLSCSAACPVTGWENTGGQHLPSLQVEEGYGKGAGMPVPAGTAWGEWRRDPQAVEFLAPNGALRPPPHLCPPLGFVWLLTSIPLGGGHGRREGGLSGNNRFKSGEQGGGTGSATEGPCRGHGPSCSLSPRHRRCRAWGLERLVSRSL